MRLNNLSEENTVNQQDRHIVIPTPPAETSARLSLDYLVSQVPVVIFSHPLFHVRDLSACKLSFISEAITHLTGYTAKECLENNWWYEHVHADDRNAVITSLLTLNESEDISLNYRLRTRSGAYRLIHDKRQIIANPGEMPWVAGCWLEMEDRIRPEFSTELDVGLLEHIHDSVITTDMQGTITGWNLGAEKQLGYGAEEIIGKPIHDLYPDHDKYQIQQADFMQLLRDSDGLEFESMMRTKSGEDIYVHTSLSPFHSADGQMSGIVSYTIDVSRQRRAEEELRKLSLAVEQSPTVVIITNTDARIEYVNPKFTEVTGYTVDEAIGEPMRLSNPDDSEPEIHAELCATIKSGKEWRGEIHNRKKNGELYWAAEIITPITNAEGVVTHFLATQEDITEARKLTQQLSWQASHDTLTGLINRREFERRLFRLHETINKDSKHVLCYLDLDQFKVVNDTCGHVAGDELLKQMGGILNQKVRQRDTLARLGGDEFGILLEQCSVEQAMRAIKGVKKAVETFIFGWEGHSYRLGVSIGVVSIDINSGTITDVLKKADAACYAAKDAGRNRIHTYCEKDADLARRDGEMQWVSEINLALQENRFMLYSQTISSVSETIKGPHKGMKYEFLLRMIDRQGGIIPPGAFLPAAERYNLSPQLDRWVIDHALAWLAAHPEHVADLVHCGINLSGLSLCEESFTKYVVSKIRSSEVAPDKICFEITETAAISNLTTATSFINTIKELGCKFALDDFGSGLSSFAYLKNLPVDYLKIDGVFIKDMVNDPVSYAMVKSINEIGKVMNKKTIAEFVEDDNILEALRELGVDYAQGYGISKPSPVT